MCLAECFRHFQTIRNMTAFSRPVIGFSMCVCLIPLVGVRFSLSS